MLKVREAPLVGDTDRDQKLVKAGMLRKTRIQVAAISKEALSGL